MTIAPQGTNQSLWLPTEQDRADTEFRLVCFAHAGGGPNIFHSWSKAYGPKISVCPLAYPGRWSRHREPSIPNIPQLVNAAYAGMEHVLRGRFAFFGYSFGANVAFELARTLRRHGRVGPTHLFIAARRAPQLTAQFPPIHQLPDAAFLREMDSRYGGIPEAVRRDPELLALVLPALRADMTAIETYRYTPEPPLDIPITVFVGEDDTRLNAPDAQAWSEQTTAEFACHVLPGDHFVLNRSGAEVQRTIQKAIENSR